MLRWLRPRPFGPPSLRIPGIAFALVAILAASALAADTLGDSGPPDDAQRPVEAPADGYASSRECGACHPQSHATWRDSYHRRMTQIAGPESVLAPFEGVELAAKGATYQLRNEDGAFRVTIRGEGDSAMEREVVLTTGSHHFQIYWTATAKGREVELFPFAYQVAEERWIETNHLILSDPKRVQLASIWNVSLPESSRGFAPVA